MKIPLTIFATYWNEKDWIEASLAQIDTLNAREVIIVDGCFDPEVENRSTDGTREIIEQWVSERPHAKMISAIRISRRAGLWYLFGKQLHWWNWPLRIALFAYYWRTNLYRINQAVTFTHMLRTAQNANIGDWIMHNDADQFYPDAMVEQIQTQVNCSETDIDLLTANEQSFFTDFKGFTTQYDSRDYNNMPYRIQKNTIILPTRDVAREEYPKPKIYGKNASLKKKHLGSYFHYKFRPFDKNRSELGNNLGDRKQIDHSNYEQVPFLGTHPTVIQKYYGAHL